MSETPAPYKVEPTPRHKVAIFWLIPRDEDGAIISAMRMYTHTVRPAPLGDLLTAARIYMQNDPQAVWVGIFDNAHERPALRRLRAIAWKPCTPHGATGIQTHITQEGLDLR